MKAFILNPNVFIWEESNNILLYDSTTGKKYFYDTSKAKSIRNLFTQLKQPRNLYRVNFNETDIDLELQKVIDHLCTDSLGRVVDANCKKVAIPPILRILSNKPGQDYNAFGPSQLIRTYLNRITIYVGGEGTKNDYYKQIIYPYYSDKMLSTEDIIRCINRIDNDTCKIDIVFGADLGIMEELSYSLTNSVKNRVRLYLPYSLDVSSNPLVKKLINDGFKIAYIVDRIQTDRLTIDNRCRYSFVIRDVTDYEQAMSFSIDDREIMILYDGNEDFFEKEILMNEEEVKGIFISKREVFVHQSINVNYWGHFYIHPDLCVYSDSSKMPIGRIDEGLPRLIQKELQSKTSWLRTRNGGLCEPCLYKWLCPSPTGYEKYLHNKICNFR